MAQKLKANRDINITTIPRPAKSLFVARDSPIIRYINKASINNTVASLKYLEILPFFI
jgi:hypothetical protein